MKDLGLSDLVEISETLSQGLQAGKDLRGILKWLEVNASSPRIKEAAGALLVSSKTTHWEESLQSQKESWKKVEARLLIEILAQSRKGHLHLSQLLNVFSHSLRMVIKLEQRQKSLLFIPRFQAGISVFVAFLFGVILPFCSSELFPSFWQLGRSDLFFVGFGGVAIGLILLYWMSLKPRQNFQQILQMVFFWVFLSVLIQSGLDLISAWRRTLCILNFPPKLRILFNPLNANVDGLQKFLEKLEICAPSLWRRSLVGLRWAYANGIGLSSFLKETAQTQSEEIFYKWDDEIRRLSVLSVLPISFFIFPSVMFLLLGPRLLEMLQ